MSGSAVPNGRIDMKYVIHRLEEISSSKESPYIKTLMLDKYLDELMATLGREGGDTFSKAPSVKKGGINEAKT